MKKLLQVILLTLPFYSFSQTLSVKAKRCATFEVLENFRKLNPKAETDQQFETWLTQKKNARTMRTQSVATLPVIFHIIHSNEAEGSGANISQTLIQQQILQLNKDFANLSNSPYGVSANANIQFALAQTDPAGSPLAQPGIDRIYYSTAGFAAPPYTVGAYDPSSDYLGDIIKPATIWDPARYLNIWVLEMEAGILGIATFPSSSGIADLGGSGDDNTNAGVAVGPETVGSIFMPSSCASYTKGKTLTHEMGHFFGLRHIWGDATCGNDYCGDTPVHASENLGVPSHPKANSCGTADEMFENYMDYTDDVTLNTFTADQVARMQTVLANSPRRNTLAASTVGLVAVSATNRIAFYNCVGAITVKETGISGTTLRYHDYSFALNVEDKATGSATVTVNAGGSAISGFNYQLLTPSLNFVNGDDYKAVNIRVFDNALVEGNKTIVLTYTISGTGVQAGASSQSMTITVLDDDNIIIANDPVTLLSQNFDTQAEWRFLFGGGPNPNKFVIGNGGNAGGTGNCGYVSNSTVAPFVNTYDINAPSLAVLQTPLINTSGYTDIKLNFKYRVYGEKSGSNIYDFGQVMYSPGSNNLEIQSIAAPNVGPYVGESGIVSDNPTIDLPNSTFANSQFYLGFYWENNGSGGTNPPLNIDDVVVTGRGVPIETTVSNSFGADVITGAGINNFRSTNNRMIARITNSNENLSAITASVTQAGTGQTPLATTDEMYMRTEKVIQLTPSIANSTATYQATLYFTSAELAVWGANKLALKIVKIKDGVSLSGNVNSTDVVLVNPVSAVEDAATGIITYTANFTGFSQFVLALPSTTLPVGSLTFDAQPAKNNIELTWKTASEHNNKGFSVERSTNGIDFTAIGWVAGKGTTSTSSAYAYSDHNVQSNTVYYYRLQQIDFDSRSRSSIIRQAKIMDNGVLITVSPNPAKNKITVLVAGNTQPINISLVNAKGQTVAKLIRATISAPYQIDVSRYAKGYYNLILHLPDGDVTKQLILQ
ncbi:MAG: hypothetical protein JWR72_1357 [Flavisolibacter sp.]|nr:hypothetical protein [Flavisolibacter sp.]